MDLSFYWYTPKHTHTSYTVTKYTQNKFISAYCMRQGFWRQTPQKWKITDVFICERTEYLYNKSLISC